MTNLEQKEIEVKKYLKEKRINATITGVFKNGFSYLLYNGEEWYMRYDEMC